MKSLIVASLSTFFLSTISAGAVRAEQTAYNPNVSGQTPSYNARLTPVDLVSSAYRGQLQNQGIPGYSDLIIAYQANQIGATDLVRSAVRSKLVPQEVLTDEGYLNAVVTQLDNLKGESIR